MRSVLKALLVSTLFGASAASAADATLTLNLPALSYSTTETKVKPDGGTEAKETTSGLATADLSQSYASVQFGSFLFYAYPFVDSKMVSLSYAVSEMIEVGLNLGLSSTKLKEAKTDSNKNLVGIFAWVYPKLGAVNAEAGLSIDQSTETGKSTTSVTVGTTTTTAEAKTNMSTLDVKLVANILVPLAKNLNYTAGFWYLMSNMNDKENKVKSTDGGFGLNIASLRLTLN